nr:hypothetical protein GCM10020093_016480 [Planobispora longispora]
MEEGQADEARALEVVERLRAALGEGIVHVTGSRRLGCALPGADLDLVAVLPGTPDLADVEARVRAALPETAAMRRVTGARVPGLRLRLTGPGPRSLAEQDPGPGPGPVTGTAPGRVTGHETGPVAGTAPGRVAGHEAGPVAGTGPGTDLDVDLVVVAAGRVAPAEAVPRRAELGEAAAIALSAVSDADAVLDAVGAGRAAFAGLARRVKAWARARGLDSAPYGGLPGLAWTVLAARTAIEAGELPADDLLRHFFGTWAAWDWNRPAGLRPDDLSRDDLSQDTVSRDAVSSKDASRAPSRGRSGPGPRTATPARPYGSRPRPNRSASAASRSARAGGIS